MRLLNRIRISTKVFSGFAIILLLLLIISAVSLYSIISADNNFKKYRSLARQTNADGRFRPTYCPTAYLLLGVPEGEGVKSSIRQSIRF